MPQRPLKDTDLLKTARERFKLANESDSAQAQRERDDIAFEDGDQWPADIKLARMGQAANNGLPAVPARPTLVINQVQEPVRQVLNSERNADIGVEIVPADDFGDLGVVPDDTEVTLREGLVRRIQRESEAADARTWAFKRAVVAGRGFYLVMTRFLPGKTWDQEVYVARIFNQAGVLLDPAHEQPDGSDTDWEFLGTWVQWDRYTSEYDTLADGKPNPFSDYNEGDFIAMTEAYPDWYKAEGEQRAVRVVNYWYTERVSREAVLLSNEESILDQSQLQLTTVWREEIADTGIPEGFIEKDTRRVVEKQIKYCKIGGGIQVLEETDWAGPDMPIVKVLGDEVLPYDEQRRVRGMVRPSRDAQMGLNYMISKDVEVIGLSPIPRDRIDPDAIDGYEAWWQVANTRTLPYLPYRTRDDQGNEFRQPTPGNGDPNILPIAQAIALFKESVQATTGGAAPNRLGVGQQVQSARAINRLQEEEQFNTSNFLDNLVRSMRYEGQIENNLLYPIYGARPDRLVRIMTGEGESETWMVGDPAQQQQAAERRKKASSVAKLTKDAHFNVAVKVTKNSELRRDQESSALGELIAAEPTMMTWFGDIYLRSRDIPSRKQLSERAKVMLAPPIQAMLAAKEEGQEFDPVAQAKIAQLEQRLQMAEQAMKELDEIANGKKLESQTKLQIEQMGAQKDIELERMRLTAEHDKSLTELQRAQMDNATKIRVAEIAAETKGIVSAQAMEHEAMALAHEQEHEAVQAAEQREHEERVAVQSQAHEAAMAEGGMEHESDEAERNRQAAAAEGEANRQAHE